jgi:hypothetical protein
MALAFLLLPLATAKRIRRSARRSILVVVLLLQALP